MPPALRRYRQGLQASGVPRETWRAVGRPRMARTGLPAAPGSRRRGSVGGRPRYGGRAACPPAPSDSPSLGTHAAAQRPARCAGTWAGLSGATPSPVLAVVPGLGTTLCLSGSDAIERSTQAGHLAMHPGAAWGPQPVPSWTLASLSLLALELRSPPTAGAPAQQLAGTAIVVLLGMPGRTVVTGSGRSRYCAPGSGACSASQPAGRACSLATGARVGPASVDTCRTVEGGTST
jgi:hypothetical protein